MKRFVSLVLICVMLTSAVPSANTEITSRNRGSFGANRVSYGINDVLNILKHLAGMSELSDEQKQLYDFVRPRGVGIEDALEILKALAGMDSVFGLGKFNAAHELAEAVRIVNTERAKEKLPSLSHSHALLNKAALIRLEETAVNWAHERPNGEKFSTVLKECKVEYSYAGENIARGQRSAARVMEQWLDSPGHRKNIMGDYTHIAIVADEFDGVVHWVQLFIREPS